MFGTSSEEELVFIPAMFGTLLQYSVWLQFGRIGNYVVLYCMCMYNWSERRGGIYWMFAAQRGQNDKEIGSSAPSERRGFIQHLSQKTTETCMTGCFDKFSYILER